MGKHKQFVLPWSKHAPHRGTDVTQGRLPFATRDGSNSGSASSMISCRTQFTNYRRHSVTGFGAEGLSHDCWHVKHT